MSDLVPGSKFSVRLLWPFARLLGGDPELLSVLGLSVEEFVDPETRVSHRAVMHALAAVIERTSDPAIGLRAGLALDAADLGFIEQAARTAPTLSDAARIFAKHSKLLTDGAQAAFLMENDGGVWRLSVAGIAGTNPAVNDFTVGAEIAFLRRNLPTREEPLEIRVAHPRPAYADEYRRLLGVEPRFGAPSTAIVVRPATLSAPMRHSSPGVWRAFEAVVERRAAELESHEGTAELVRGVVSVQFQEGTVSMRRTARQLAMSVATLRRRLEEEGTTFSGVVDGLRQQMAARYLRESEATVSEVAFRLGFAGVASFGRAFKRWSGVTPSVFRGTPSVVHRAPPAPSFGYAELGA
jgi:AraC-like DNA-binding protein